MEFLHHFFQLLPIALACIAAVTCSIRFSKDKRKADRAAMMLGAFSSILLIIAQTSWWTTYLIENSLQGIVFANYVWTVFNSAIMITLIMTSNAFRK